MSVKVRFDQTLQKISGAESLDAEGETIGEVLGSLATVRPELKTKLCDQNGYPQKWLSIWVDNENIRFMDDLATKVNAKSDVYFLLGGSGG